MDIISNVLQLFFHFVGFMFLGFPNNFNFLIEIKDSSSCDNKRSLTLAIIRGRRVFNFEKFGVF